MSITKHQLRLVTLMLFSLFFGAGNLIIPPMVGRSAGVTYWVTMIAFGITAVVLPVLGTYAVSKFKGLMNLAGLVTPLYGLIFTLVIFLSIGPLLGIPRAGSLPFEMVIAPYIPKSFNVTFARFLYTFVFFSIAYWLCMTPSKIVTRVGKYLTPCLLFLLVLLFVGCIVKPLGTFQEAAGNYRALPFLEGFKVGYQTMDAIAALNFGVVIGTTIHSFHVEEEKEKVKITLLAGILAGSILMTIYLGLAYIGATSSQMFPQAENGAQLLSYVSLQIFKDYGAFLLAIIFSLACLTTCVGLLSSISDYFYTLTKKGTYQTWLLVWTLLSMGLANFGLTAILKYSIPALTAIYPPAITLILLGVFGNVFHHAKLVYRACVGVATLIGVIDGLSSFVPSFAKAIAWLPFYAQGFSWVVPTCVALVISLCVVLVKNEQPVNNKIEAES